MAHGITGSDQMAFRGATPWHKLGNQILDSDTFDEAWAKSGLVWNVEGRPLFQADGTPVDAKAIVRSDNGEILAHHVGKDWETFQNTEMRDRILRPLVETGLVALDTVGSLWGGKRVWALGKVAGGKRGVGVTNDELDLYVLAAQGHDGLMGLFLGGTAVRVVCNNTLSIALGDGGLIKIRHTSNMRVTVDAAREALKRALGMFDKAIELFTALSAKRYTNEQLTAYLGSLFPVKKTKAEIEAEGAADFARLLGGSFVDKRSEIEVLSAAAARTTSRANDRILEILQSGEHGTGGAVEGTAWAAYNAVTGYLTHERGRSDDARLAGAWFGPTGPAALQSAAQTFLGAGAN